MGSGIEISEQEQKKERQSYEIFGSFMRGFAPSSEKGSPFLAYDEHNKPKVNAQTFATISKAITDCTAALKDLKIAVSKAEEIAPGAEKNLYVAAELAAINQTSISKEIKPEHVLLGACIIGELQPPSRGNTPVSNNKVRE